MEVFGDDEKRREEWEKLNVTRNELDNISECLKKEEFRKLLVEYVDEINDPENRRRYEQEIKQLERERGIDVTFVKPEAHYVIKTSLDGNMKCFINIGTNDCVDKPSSRPAENGLQWSIPHLLVPPRDDLDKRHSKCRIFDVVFHPDTLHLAQKNPKFRDIVNDTAMDGIENNFKIKLDRKNIRYPKATSKGMSLPSVIRKSCEVPEEKLDIDPEIYQKLMSSYDENRERKTKSNKKQERPSPTVKYYNKRENETEEKHTTYTKPKFIIKHQSHLDLEEFWDTKDAKLHSAIPKNLVIIINLPLLRSATDATLDVKERHLSLKSEKPAKYLLELPLTYSVEADKGSAKFDPKSKRLTVTLPVKRNTTLSMDPKEDSGVESDHGSPPPKSEINDSLLNPDYSDIENLRDELCEVIVDKRASECDNSSLRTNCDTYTVPFLDSNIKYNLPQYTCNIYDDVLAITIHAKNVDTNSIDHKILKNDSGIHIVLASVGAGFFPVYYSLCLKIEDNAIKPDTLNVEPWDNNVVLSVNLKNTDSLAHYYAGIDENSMEIKNFSTSASIKNKLQALVEDSELETDKNVEVIRSGKEVIVNVHSQNADSDDENDNEETSPREENPKRSFLQSRSISESSGDELASSFGSSGGSGRYKSILKSRFSRSISESSIDSSAQFSSITFNDTVNEFNSESEGSSLKKTVRFNDVISQKLYRSNSSILGQRKKNQRKLKNKKRALERRMSESENSETEEREKYKINTKKESHEESTETIRPILHNNNKIVEAQKTANIEIQRSVHNNNKRKQKRNPAKNDSTKDTKNKVETDNHSDADESKHDLLFDLDM